MSELEDLMTELGAVDPTRSPMDRYRDFRQLFLGTDQGKRVLADVLEWGHNWKSTAVRGDSHETYRREGERNLMLKILTAIHMEPREPVTRQQSTEPKD